MKKPFKKTILLDLDGVLNTYDGDFDPDFIPQIKNGAFEFVQNLSKDYKVVIFTSRNLLLASKWILENKLDKYINNVTNTKEPSFIIIDDRCLTFCGEYNILKDKIDNFKAWFKV